MVVIKGASGSFAFKCHVHSRRIREIDVQPAIAVVIEKQHTTAHRFDNEFLLGSTSVAKPYSGLGKNIGQLGDFPLNASIVVLSIDRAAQAENQRNEN